MARKRRYPLVNRPDRNGWWLWFEDAHSKGEEILVSAGGRCVAYDDEWAEEMAREPNEVYSENYWEGTDTTQEQMPGKWRFLRERKVKHG